jgi:precorrin-2 dehydrogenase/sirohydrochlorin ferrochelatase
MTSHSYPVLLQIKDKPCVVVGGGHVAERKVRTLLEAEAEVTVISPGLTASLAAWADENRFVWRAKHFEPADITGAWLVFAATDHPEVNQAVYNALEPNQLINIADNPALSTFTVPAQLRRGRLLLTASTEGASPGLSRKIVAELADKYDEAYGTYVDFLAESRAFVLEQVPDGAVRRKIFQRLLDDEFFTYAERKETDKLWDVLNQMVRDANGQDT